MFSPELNYLVTLEKHKDRMREIEHQQFIQAAGLEKSVNLRSRRKAAGWLGHQLVKWGSKLQEYDTLAPTETLLTKKV